VGGPFNLKATIGEALWKDEFGRQGEEGGQQRIPIGNQRTKSGGHSGLPELTGKVLLILTAQTLQSGA